MRGTRLVLLRSACKSLSGQALWTKLTKQASLQGCSPAVLHPMSRTKDRGQARRNLKRRRRKRLTERTSEDVTTHLRQLWK